MRNDGRARLGECPVCGGSYCTVSDEGELYCVRQPHKTIQIELEKEEDIMTREEFGVVLRELRRSINCYTDGHSLIEDSDYLHENSIIVQEVEDNIVGHSRWAVNKEVIYKIADEFYISIQWDSPATEMQEGQYTNCTVCEVRPIQRLITEFVIVN